MKEGDTRLPKSQVPGSRDRGAGPLVTRESGTDSLPCLYSNNCIEESNFDLVDHALLAANLLTNYHRKQAQTLCSNIERLIALGPSINHFGFLTLTTSDGCDDFREMSDRFRSLNSNFLKPSPDYGEWARATERHKGYEKSTHYNAIHYHMLIQLAGDVATGMNWDLWRAYLDAKKKHQPWRHLQRAALKDVTEYLRTRWSELREILPKYGFGRSELLPIRSTSEAVGLYIGGYVGKHVENREPQDKGIRLIAYSQEWLKNSPKFSWNNENAQKWRENVQKFANYTVGYTGNPDADHLRLQLKFGKNWAYKYRDMIIGFDEYIEEVNGEDKIPF